MRETHPYGVFIPPKARAMIVGSFPIGKFSNPKRRHEIKEHELNFFFGGEKNLLWKLLGYAFDMPVSNVSEIKRLLKSKGLAVGDVIHSCKRKSGGGSDKDLYDIHWNDELLDIIRKNKIHTIYFTSKKVESWFNKLFKETDDISKVSLISPSGQSVRSITRRADYLAWRRSHPEARTVDFIYDFYRQKFNPTT